MITIDLDGHSQSDQFVFVPWNEVRDMALQLVDSCVYFLSRGGFITYGVGRTLESLIYPTTYGGDNAEFPYPAWVWEPDGTAEFVAIPSNPATDEYNIPYYMTITVSAPLSLLNPEATDYATSLAVMAEAQRRFLRSRDITMQNSLARILDGLESNQISLRGRDHSRWWQYPIGPPTPIPVNVKYACEATLGSPSTANCEAALFEFLQSGEVILDPASGPIIKISGNCAIAVGANERHPVTWDMLRSVAEILIATCISSPGSGSLGGTAISQTIRTRRRSQSTGKRQAEMLQVAFPPTFEIAVYLQPPFNGPADATCPWGVVASHQGDVRSCPVNYVPVRPPERNLGMNATLAGNLTGPIISASSLNVTANYTSNVAAVVPFKLPIAAREPCIKTSLGRLTCPGPG
ncbi:MAG: hypothetical protein ASARMPREDX12_006656 [Alectoria sarmentosa]|nr:MAG: hypothetical protein ASARMPREDX12_006656 [Alectoria sarmentosa]